MRNHGSSNERVGDAGITTEDIARPASASETGTRTDEHAESRTAQGDRRTRPVYPGEATADAAAEEQGARESGEGLPGDSGAATESTRADSDEPLLGADDTAKYQEKWGEIQGRFVDDPQEAVRSADAVVAEVMQTLARSFSAHKQGLEEQWGQGEQVATEDLRLALQHYRSFFNRLLKT
ncbi:hypothetical protein J3A78_000106 [Streptomyces sp. PvR006]|uniref:hypothetical protein n=1 Tax=Streptomyces sp. PvR006 TaxID=2817860 RepID=UPI001AE8666D|nr:hypothetical protein [Streptomyces sp. PvR006]MBP2579628.1 hypothetical protein [Streptomyces sp. PvR006]